MGLSSFIFSIQKHYKRRNNNFSNIRWRNYKNFARTKFRRKGNECSAIFIVLKGKWQLLAVL